MTRSTVLLLAAVSCLAAREACAQPASMVQGRVVTPIQNGTRPVPGVWVTLHRVGTDTAGVLDSVRTDAAGRYSFRYRPSGTPNAAYFVTASHAGIAYFAPPLTGSDVRGGDAEITVFDTTSAALPLRVRGRHLAVANPSEGRRAVIEVYEISNDTTLTRVAGTPERPTFIAMVPRNATSVRVGQGDIPAEATRAEPGRVLVFAPFAPGLKQLSFSYELEENEFPLSVPITAQSEVLEVLLEDPSATAAGAGLRFMGEVPAEGRTFRRYLAQDVGANSVLRIITPPSPDAPRRWGIFVTALVSIIALVLLGVLGRVITRSRTRVRVLPSPETDAERLAREIALLDAQSPGDIQRRAELMTRLHDALK